MGERTDTGGIAAALAVLGARGGVVDENGSQVDLFGAVDAPLPLASKGVSGPKGGRPAGALNRSTLETTKWLLSRYRSPLEVLAEIYSRPVGELVDELQAMADRHKKTRSTENGYVESVVLVDPLQVLKLQRDAAVALAPYIHKQQPKDIAISEKPRGVMILGDLGVIDAQSDDVAIPFADDGTNQQLSDADSEQSDGSPLGDDRKRF